MRRLFFNSVSLSVGLLGAQALTALAYWLTARSLHPAEFGRLAACVGVAMLVSTAADLGFNAWLVRELARDPTSPFAPGLGVRLSLAVVVAVLWSGVAGGAWLLGAASAYVPLLGLWILLALLWSTLLVPARAAERMQAVAAVSTLERLVLVVVVLVCAQVVSAELSLVVGFIGGAAVATVASFALLEPGLRHVTRPTIASASFFFRRSLGFAASSLALQAQRLDVVIVGALAGPHAAGIYAAPARLTNALGIMPTAFSAALFPRAAREQGPFWSKPVARGLALMVAAMILVETPLFLFAPRLAALLLGEEYRSSGGVLRVILVGLLIATVNQPLAVARQARGDEHRVARAIGAGCVIGLVGIAIGSAIAGATGGAFGFVALQSVILLALTVDAPAARSAEPKAVGHASL